jgi:hypothetical protein
MAHKNEESYLNRPQFHTPNHRQAEGISQQKRKYYLTIIQTTK